MAEEGTLQALRELRDRKKAQEEYDSVVAGLSGDLQKRIESAGQNWWVKPSILVDLIEHADSDQDFQFVGALAAQVDNKKVNAAFTRAVEMAEEEERKRKDRGFQLDDLADPVKGVTRLAFSAAESGYQEAQGVFRSVVGGLAGGAELASRRSGTQFGPGRDFQKALKSVKGEGFVGSQSSLGITIGKLFGGDISPGELIFGDPDATGSGFFPGGEIQAEQRRRAFRSASIGDQSVTPGRLVAHLVSEQGTDAYNWLSGSIDAGIITVADPANPVLGAAGKAVKARRYFQPEETKKFLGLVQGQRKTITDAVNDWLPSRPGRKFVDYLAETDNPVEIWEASRRQIPVEWAVELSKVSDPNQVDTMVRQFLGTQVARKPKGWHYTPAGVAVRSFTTQAPLFGQMPRTGMLDTYNPQAFVTQIADELKNAHVPVGEARELVRKAMVAATSGPPGMPLASDRYSVLTATREAMDAQLRAAGVGADKSRRLNRIWNSYQSLRAYNIDVLTGHAKPLPNEMTVAGSVLPTPTPQTIEQMLSRFVPLPDARTVREISKRTSKVARLSVGDVAVGQRLADLGVAAGLAADTLSMVWKPQQLLRAAYAPRVIGDEQGRMASAGMASMFRNPLSYLSIAVMDDGRLGKRLEQLGVTVGRYGTNTKGNPLATAAGGRLEALDEQLNEALYQGASDLLFGGKTRRVPGFVPIARNEEGFFDAWLDEVKFLHDNPIARKLAVGEPIDEIKEWYWNSGYRAAAIGSGDVARVTDDAGRAAAERLAPLGRQVQTRAGSDAYIDHMLEWVDSVTQGDAGLVEAVATGRIPLEGSTVSVHRNFKPTRQARAYVEGLDGAGAAPEFVRGSPQLAISKDAEDYWRSGVDLLMDVIAVRPSNWASRHVTWVQVYWKRVEDLADLADPDQFDDVIRVAREEAKLPEKAVRRLEGIQARGTLDADDLHALAAQYATDETKRLLYDLHNRGRFFDAMRLVFPFGEAWKEVFTTWARLLTENPRSLRTLQKGITGARGAGIIYNDEKTGEEMFTFPATGALMDMVGVQGDFRATTAGLSIAGSVIPGFGPAAQWGVGTFLPDKPEFKFVRDAVFQYGGEDEGIIKTLVPGWAEKWQKWLGAPESDRQFNAAVGEAMNALASTGKYDLTDDDDVERLQDKAVSVARATFFWRGVLQFVMPSAPQPRQFVTTKKGLRVTQALTEEFFRLASLDYDSAVQTFVDRFGEDALIATVPYTNTTVNGKRVYGIRPSEEFGEWEASHGALFDLYPRVAGLFGPQDEGYDYQVYERQARRFRTPKSPAERVNDRNSMLARMAFDRYKAKLPANPTPAQKRWLADIRRELVAAYPGWNPNDINLGDVSGAVEDLRRAATHKSVKNTELAEAVTTYFEYRDKAIDASPTSGWNTAKKSKYLRDWLRGVADEIGEQVPDFNRVWDMVLSREMTDDLDEEN